jgi:hypothetical protein
VEGEHQSHSEADETTIGSDFQPTAPICVQIISHPWGQKGARCCPCGEETQISEKFEERDHAGIFMSFQLNFLNSSR